MSTTPLPPLPTNTPHVTRRIRACESEVPAQVVLEHALHAYAQQARADLDAENQRLREALRLAHDHIDMNALRISHCKDAEAINAALKGTP